MVSRNTVRGPAERARWASYGRSSYQHINTADWKERITMEGIHHLITTIYHAFNTRNIDRVLAAMHPDVDWPNGWEGGRVYGREGVRDYWERQWAAIDPHVEPTEITTEESGRTIVRVHATVKDLAGRVISEGEVEHIYEIEGGLIKSMEIRNP